MGVYRGELVPLEEAVLRRISRSTVYSYAELEIVYRACHSIDVLMSAIPLALTNGCDLGHTAELIYVGGNV